MLRFLLASQKKKGGICEVRGGDSGKTERPRVNSKPVNAVFLPETQEDAKNHRNFYLGFFYFFQALLPCHLEVDRLSVCLVTIYPCLCDFFLSMFPITFFLSVFLSFFFSRFDTYFSFITLSLSSLLSFPHFFSGSV